MNDDGIQIAQRRGLSTYMPYIRKCILYAFIIFSIRAYLIIMSNRIMSVKWKIILENASLCVEEDGKNNGTIKDAEPHEDMGIIKV